MSFCGLHNFQYIVDVNQPNIKHRIQLPDEVVHIASSYITIPLDLFIVAETLTDFIIMKFDLDRFEDPLQKKGQIFQYEIVYQYTKEDVDFQPLSDLHVRSSSAKQAISLNKKMQIFVIHGKTLFTYCEGTQYMRLVMDLDCQNFNRLDDDNIFFRKDIETKKGQKIFQFLQLNIEFSSFSIESIYEEKQDREVIETIGYDFAQNILLLLKVNPFKQQAGKRISVIDLNERNVLYSAVVSDTELIGRLLANVYLLIDGHMYYNNKCIKIRYDLLTGKKTIREFSEYEVFDYYEKVLQLNINQQVSPYLPICTPETHRLIYVIQNKKTYACKQVLILPYLHERKILLTKIKEQKNYFYTTLKKTIQSQHGDHTFTSLIMMNLSDHKYYVYSPKGIMIKRHDFSAFCRSYGNPKAVSNNGQVFVFKKS